MLMAVVITSGSLWAIGLLLTGGLTIDLPSQSFMLLIALTTAVGGVISIIISRLHSLRSYVRDHLEAMSEGQAQEYVWQLGIRTRKVALMREMVSAGVKLNRGEVISQSLTNQHLEQARLDAKVASAPPENLLSPAATLLQSELSKRANKAGASGLPHVRASGAAK